LNKKQFKFLIIFKKKKKKKIKGLCDSHE